MNGSWLPLYIKGWTPQWIEILGDAWIIQISSRAARLKLCYWNMLHSSFGIYHNLNCLVVGIMWQCSYLNYTLACIKNFIQVFVILRILCHQIIILAIPIWSYLSPLFCQIFFSKRKTSSIVYKMLKTINASENGEYEFSKFFTMISFLSLSRKSVFTKVKNYSEKMSKKSF